MVSSVPPVHLGRPGLGGAVKDPVAEELDEVAVPGLGPGGVRRLVHALADHAQLHRQPHQPPVLQL
eukprot:7530537-Pyramimonas_sp.AAC.1